jgi:hypothetical protein
MDQGESSRGPRRIGAAGVGEEGFPASLWRAWRSYGSGWRGAGVVGELGVLFIAGCEGVPENGVTPASNYGDAVD